ncbi:Predicted enzyme with a TIM-barrel fold [Propionibacterium australiense]|uniref:Pyridoxal phosphate homeostasis protein n=1 Tax=Propionibacterium australiense TaxID=119981 RepID=A0A383S3G5_9ACTN|nr:YggS family pyridoxal phosphate-dependent enzyme [Propionibacterium australiense]RLP11801.1 YggS family pyridoxal phosphate-dependent enzyme [Propionibacterium australiense]SYZ32487.1 Alanine racemase, N-terminal [Propionibacterium australiense]VEH90113.1 Predicted enzyme with a TIM-barrel fold [Propionibacterium australiense]
MTEVEGAVRERVRRVWDRLGAACDAAGRDRDEVRLMPVSKLHTVEQIRAVHAALAEVSGDTGRRAYGENHVQEIVAKTGQLEPEEGIDFALIGHLQTNKVNAVVPHISEFQALDSLRLAARLDRRLTELGRTLDVLVEVNTSGEPAKHGVGLDEAFGFCEALADYETLDVKGLMTVAVNSSDEQRVAACFDALVELRDRLRGQAVLGSTWCELSMGMSGDFPLAIAHGATTVRIGTALFGPRPER